MEDDGAGSAIQSVPLPRRKRIRKKDLASSLLSLEATLLARANLLGTHEGGGRILLMAAIDQACAAHETDIVTQDVLADALGDVIATEFRKLAEEMHFQ
jgi:hypothetical protein